MLDRKRKQCFRLFSDGCSFATKLMEIRNKVSGKSQSKRMGYLVGQVQCGLRVLQGLIRITKKP